MEIWQQTRSPPPEFQDYLYERGYYRAAAAVKWCVECRDREQWNTSVTARPFPSELPYPDEFQRYIWIDGDNFSDSLPWIEGNTNKKLPTLTDALFFLLDSYPEELL